MRVNRSGRRGFLLVAVLVAMGIATTILLGTVQSSLKMRRDLRQHIQVEQTRWMLDMGIRHAIRNARDQADYSGEELAVRPAIDKYRDGKIEITVQGKSDLEIRLEVTASLQGPGSSQRSTTRRSEVFSVQLGPAPKSVP